MAHKKAAGSKARQGGNIAGKRLGIKVFGNQTVKAGSIILRQRGTNYHRGQNVGVGRDHTLYAEKEGKVQYRVKQGRSFVEVISQ
jgi:large subunit ribosomal protein L27